MDPSESTPTSFEDLSVCLIEPSSTQQLIIERELENLGVVEILTEKTGATALETINSCRPDLVISSMHLPDMTGTELVLALRQTPLLESIPFMLISSETGYKYLEPIRQAGVVALLPKPFTSQDLKNALNATIDLYDKEGFEISDMSICDLKALVVDDSRMSRKYIARVLSNLGLENITEANNGHEAIEILESELFDLVVTDFNMPEVNGQDLTLYIRNQSQQPTIPVLLVTSEQDENRLEAVQQAGVSAVYDKPFEPDSVRQLLMRMLVQDAAPAT